MDQKEESLNCKIFNFLRKDGCCLICCLRYLKGHGKELLDVKSSLEKRGIVVPEDGQNVVHPCPCCLNLFSEHCLYGTLCRIRKKDDFCKFFCEKFVLSFCLPVGLDIRQLIIWMKLIGEFGDVISKDERMDTTPKDALRSILIPQICECLKAEYDREGVMITLTYRCKIDEDESAALAKIKPECFQQKKENKKIKTELNRTAVEKYLVPSRLRQDEWEGILKIPQACEDSFVAVEITYTGPTVFVAGRYQKFSRELSQTPWILQGERMVMNSVQEIIEGSLVGYFTDRPMKESKICFSASGREDVDVRCLGRGRPFVLEITNSYISDISPVAGRAIEENIAKSGHVAVTHLQVVDRAEVVRIKEGEESKKKMYRALCLLESPATVEIMKKLNISEEFTVQQFTPIRVLHRRALMTRPRIIYSVKARLSKDHNCLLVIDIQTQAGTYVKELVHGEFGRTQPSLATIIGQKIDILSLDVTDIDLDWPKPVNYMH
ncbi:putative tRNA pseudouridine synthase Pus10 [Lutzomyia longipalpis]|uniref:putative tRNA pseudouridine synthase Pus10 n=1 Tax=Lutzomyia longipalpis TaxID=7200 RepID=UPI002483F25F|nr:putative tRNA pseudouridine synthase Pus10 [Lutzomyia longipalpis]